MSDTNVFGMLKKGESPDWFFIRRSLLDKAKEKHSLDLEDLVALRACDAVIDNDRHSARIVARKVAEIPINKDDHYHDNKNKTLSAILNAMEISLKLKRRR